MFSFRTGLFIACTLLGTHLLAAQPSSHVTLTGTVTSADTAEPLPGTHVFIASSMIGTTVAWLAHNGLATSKRYPILSYPILSYRVGRYSLGTSSAMRSKAK